MGSVKITHAEVSAEGAILTFDDGLSFCFENDFMAAARLKHGQMLIEHPAGKRKDQAQPYPPSSP